MITKQNFIKIAEILKNNLMVKGKIKTGFDLYILEQLCFYFKEDNPQFNEQKFREAVFKE